MRYYMSVILVLFTLNTVAADLVRPGPHNKIGHTKQDNKEDTFFYKLFNDELDLTGSDSSKARSFEGNTQILSQIEKLADLKERGIITEAEFADKKTILLDKIQ